MKNEKASTPPMERDYRFAEKFNRLRTSMGYTQDFIAMKLGVTYGAVSKWETGVSKPRNTRAASLARLLGVDVNILLDDDAMTPEETWQQKQDAIRAVWKKIRKRALEVYGKNPPLEIVSRYNLEWDALRDSESVIFMDLLGQVRKKAKEKRLLFQPPETESLIAWLLGATGLNPLGAHLRCPKCLKAEMHPEVHSGLDLPAKTCECGTRMIPDGQDIPFEITSCAAGGEYTFFRCGTDIRFMEEAENILLHLGEQTYDMEITRHRERIEPETDPDGNVIHDPVTKKKIMAHILPMSFLTFHPKKKVSVRKPEKITGPMEVEHWGPVAGLPSVILLPGSQEPGYIIPPDNFPGSPDELTRPEVMERALADYWKGLEIYEEMRGELIPPDLSRYGRNLTFSKFVDLVCSVNCLYMGSGPQALADKLGIGDLTELPYSYADLWRMITARLPYPGYLTGIVKKVVHKAAHGKYLNGNISDRDREIFWRLNLPEWFEEYTQNIFSMNTRSYCTDLSLRLLEDARRKIRDRK